MAICEPVKVWCAPAAGHAEDEHLPDFMLGTRGEDLLQPEFSRWPLHSSKSGSTGRASHAYRPIALQTLGKTKIPLEHAFKALLHQICDATAGEYVFLECVLASNTSCSYVERAFIDDLSCRAPHAFAGLQLSRSNEIDSRNGTFCSSEPILSRASHATNIQIILWERRYRHFRQLLEDDSRNGAQRVGRPAPLAFRRGGCAGHDADHWPLPAADDARAGAHYRLIFGWHRSHALAALFSAHTRTY
jgi:hypothetical protein